LITETLSLLCSSVLISDSALKVVLTTLYVDVKEPAIPHILSDKKTQFCLPTQITVSVNQAGTKLSSNLQSQNVREQPRNHSGSAVWREKENSLSRAGVNGGG
jgi:hypothetical protein